MNKILLTKDQVELIESGHALHREDGIYYHYPFWFKRDVNDEFGVYTVMAFDDLPDYVKISFRNEENDE